jgi:hypothetical protein
MSCSDVRSLIGGYVLHALEPHEEETVRRHLATCPDCAREHAELAPLPALLDVPLDPEATPVLPPASLEEAVLDRFAAEAGAKRGGTLADAGAVEPPLAPAAPQQGARRPRRAGRVRRWAGRPLPAAALGALLAAALTFGITRALDGDDGASTHKSYGAHLRAVAGGAPGHGTVPAPADRPYAYAKLSTSESGTQVKLEASGLGGAPGAVYELWCVYPDGSKVSAGTFRADATGHAEASMTTAARVGDYHHLRVERRLPGRDGERVLAGDIAY